MLTYPTALCVLHRSALPFRQRVHRIKCLFFAYLLIFLFIALAFLLTQFVTDKRQLLIGMCLCLLLAMTQLLVFIVCVRKSQIMQGNTAVQGLIQPPQAIYGYQSPTGSPILPKATIVPKANPRYRKNNPNRRWRDSMDSIQNNCSEPEEERQ